MEMNISIYGKKEIRLKLFANDIRKLFNLIHMKVVKFQIETNESRKERKNG